MEHGLFVRLHGEQDAWLTVRANPTAAKSKLAGERVQALLTRAVAAEVARSQQQQWQDELGELACHVHDVARDTPAGEAKSELRRLAHRIERLGTPAQQTAA